mgnify:CR=1 FL=1
MQKRNISGKNLSSVITSEDILGKDVIDTNGSFIGVVEKVLIDPSSLNFVGISIDKGFLTKGLTLGKNYIQRITDHAVFLKIRVAYEIKGMQVFDMNGKIIGRVSSIDLYGTKNKIVSINVRPEVMSIFRKEITIPYKYVKNVGDNIVLNIQLEILIKYEL